MHACVQVHTSHAQSGNVKVFGLHNCTSGCMCARMHRRSGVCVHSACMCACTFGYQYTPQLLFIGSTIRLLLHAMARFHYEALLLRDRGCADHAPRHEDNNPAKTTYLIFDHLNVKDTADHDYRIHLRFSSSIIQILTTVSKFSFPSVGRAYATLDTYNLKNQNKTTIF